MNTKPRLLLVLLISLAMIGSIFAQDDSTEAIPTATTVAKPLKKSAKVQKQTSSVKITPQIEALDNISHARIKYFKDGIALVKAQIAKRHGTGSQDAINKALTTFNQADKDVQNAYATYNSKFLIKTTATKASIVKTSTTTSNQNIQPSKATSTN